MWKIAGWSSALQAQMTYNVPPQQGTETGDFFSEFSDQFHVRVFIHCRFVDDVLSTVRVSQCAQRLCVVARRWRYG